jgi:hypothetical protein
LTELEQDLESMVDALKHYMDHGALTPTLVDIDEPKAISYSPQVQKPLNFMKTFGGKFVAVDCSTKPLMRGNRFGIYLLRPAYASVDPKNREEPVTWGPLPAQERICVALGGLRARSYELESLRAEFESELADVLLPQLGSLDYLLLDGASYFGMPGGRRFSVAVYEKARRRDLKLLTVSKNSPSLLDERGRDLITQIAVGSPSRTSWVYYPIPELRADKKNRWGDVSLVKLNPDSFRIFRCDIMDYLTERDVVQLLSPLTSISDDPRCVGYPISLYLAHDFAKVDSHAKLLYYRDLIEKTLARTDDEMINYLKHEEALSNFRTELYGLKYPWQLTEQQVV